MPTIKASSGNYISVVIAVVASLFGISANADSLNTTTSEFNSQAKLLTNALGSQLKAELLDAINSNGFEAAISVCAERAPAIAQKLSIENEATVGRVSSRPRKPSNTPLDWHKYWLRSFTVRQLNDEPAQQLERSELNEAAGEYRFMKAIPTGPLCLSCHGRNIQPSVRAAIDSRYPTDQAHGYELGDLRGAFFVTVPLKSSDHTTRQLISNTELMK